MTLDELILDVQNELTFAKALPYSIPEQEIKRIITIAEKYFYDNWRHAVEPRYLFIPQEVFSNPLFKAQRALQLPDCVGFVHDVKEPNSGSSMFGTMDLDFADSKFIGAEMFLTPFIGESIMYRTVIFSFLDLVKGFTIDTFAYDYNKNTRKLTIMGRTPRGNGMVVTIAKKIPAEDLYNDELFQRYVRAKAKLRLGDLLTTFDYNLPGGIKPNYTNLVTKAENELAAVMEMMKTENTADFMFFARW
jgi:hypothetical protein